MYIFLTDHFNAYNLLLPELHKKKGKPLHEPQQEKLSVSLIDPTWELIDPTPDIHTLFLTFNDQFFWGRLAGVEVRWSPRMTLWVAHSKAPATLPTQHTFWSNVTCYKMLVQRHLSVITNSIRPSR